MTYKAENIDTDKFLKQIRELQRDSVSNETKERQMIQKYHEGYRNALDSIEAMFFCSNYEKTSEKASSINTIPEEN